MPLSTLNPSAITDATAPPETGLVTDPLADLDTSDPHSWVTWLLDIPLKIAIIIAVGTLLMVVVRRVIGRITDRIADGTSFVERRRWRSISESQVGNVLKMANPLASARGAQRARTVGSVLRSTSNIMIGLIMFLSILGELGVNLAPFLASAGIAGVALGFGAQSLVKDFLSGTFMLLEDQYGVGDVVDFGEVVGTVEEVALRVTKVRGLDGTLWFIRNGEILRTGNKTQEWGRAIVEVRLAYTVDDDRAKAVLLACAQEIHDDPEYAPACLADPEVIGDGILTADAILLRVQMKTHAGKQWEIARAIRSRSRVHLDEAGIPLADSHRFIITEQGTPPGQI